MTGEAVAYFEVQLTGSRDISPCLPVISTDAVSLPTQTHMARSKYAAMNSSCWAETRVGETGFVSFVRDAD